MSRSGTARDRADRRVYSVPPGGAVPAAPPGVVGTPRGAVSPDFRGIVPPALPRLAAVRRIRRR